MAKRFVDTTKWDRAWFRKLDPALKCAWDYLTCACDHAGIWHIDMDLLAFKIGRSFELSELTKTFPVLVIEGDKLFIPSFIEFQYGCKIKELNPESKPHRSVLAILEKYGLQSVDSDTLTKGFNDTLKDKDKDKDQDKDKEKSDVSKFQNRFRFDYLAIFHEHANPQKKTRSLSLMAEKVGTQETYDKLLLATKNYKTFCQQAGRDMNHILTFPTFFEEWRDWVDWKSKPVTQAGRYGRVEQKPFGSKPAAEVFKEQERLSKQLEASAEKISPEQQKENEKKLAALIGGIIKTPQGAA